jgi:SNF2 family DNA or RNA helicase
VKRKCQELGLDQVIKDSPKLKFIIDKVEEYCLEGSRVIVFTHFLAFLDVLEFVLSDMEGISSCRLDGGVSGKPKLLETLIDNFNSDGSMCNVMIVSIKAGGEGLTLNGASKCIVCDPPWR